MKCEIHMNFFALPLFVFSALKILFSVTIPSVPPVVIRFKTVKWLFSYSCLSVQRGLQKDAVFILLTFILDLKRALFPFPLAHTGWGILSHSCHRLDRPLTLQGASISRLHPYSSYFSTDEDDGRMLL